MSTQTARQYHLLIVGFGASIARMPSLPEESER
jgi:hypothetical protein